MVKRLKLTHNVKKDASIVKFDNKMWDDVHLLSHITVISGKKQEF